MAKDASRVDRALILAAGQGRRLDAVSNNRPKVLTIVNDYPILDWQQSALHNSGIYELALVTGFRADLLSGISTAEFHNPHFASSNMLWSLLTAREWLNCDLVISYSDILYTHETVDALISTPGDIVIASDPLWQARYEGRTQHPLSEAELVELARDGKVMSIGKRKTPISSGRVEEFIGLMRLSQQGCKTFLHFFDEALQESRAVNETDTSWLKKAYLADFLTFLINKGADVQVASTKAPWIEIDTPQDLEWAQANWNQSFH